MNFFFPVNPNSSKAARNSVGSIWPEPSESKMSKAYFISMISSLGKPNLS